MQAHGHCPVLVVDDDESIRETLVAILQDEGYPTVGAQHGGEALDLLRRAEPMPCLILLDLMMPVMDGGAFRCLQLGDPSLASIPVVVISAYHDVEEQARALHPSGTLKKPMQLEALIAMVKKFCDKCGPRADGPQAIA